MKPITQCRICLLLIPLLAPMGARTAESTTDASRFNYLPPAWADRVVFYSSFEQGVGTPEINTIAADIHGTASGPSDGLVGDKGYRSVTGNEQEFRLTSLGLSAHRPITLMTWFRLDTPMTETSFFCLLWLGRGQARIGYDVRGKGEWCALTEPTFVTQWYNFEGINNNNNPTGGRAWFEPGEWHHVALTVTGARQIDIYLDGRLKLTGLIAGRTFRQGDTTEAIVGNSWLCHPMTLDEVIVTDCALSGDEIAEYHVSVKKLREISFSFESSTNATSALVAPRAGEARI